MSDKVQAKAEKMRVKSEHCRRVFGIPETETVIQDYRCSMNGTSGRIWITQNYVLFQSGNQQLAESIPFYRVQAVIFDKGLLSRSVNLDTDQGRYHFSSFMHPSEAHAIMRHLHEHQPAYVQLTEGEILEALGSGFNFQMDTPSEQVQPRSEKQRLDTTQFQYDKNEFEDHWGDLAADPHDEGDAGQFEDIEKVDTEASRQALRKAVEIRQMAAETLQQLETQAETIDRIDRNVDETKNYMDRSDRLLDGVESFAGSVKNTVTIDRYKKGLGAYDAPDRAIYLAEREDYTDVPLLVKHSNDDLEPGIMRFGKERFFVVNANDLSEMKKYSYKYHQVSAIVMRARHQHMDIRFRDGTDRFRCLSAYLQMISNEIVLRTEAAQVHVAFEPGVKAFQYGSIALRSSAVAGGRGMKEKHKALSSGGFFTTKKQSVVKVMDKVDDKTKNDLETQDQDLDDVDKVVGDLKAMAGAMESELDRELEQLSGTHKRVEKTTEKAHKNAYRVNRMV